MAIRIGRPPPGLERDQAFVFREMSGLVRDSDRADRAYDALVKTKNGLLISADIARHLAPEFRSWSGRVRHTPSTSSPAGAYAHDRILRELARPRGRSRLLITAGGPGSGKSTALRKGGIGAAELVFDNQFKDLPRAREILESALKHRWEVIVRYAHRNFKEVPRAVLERSQRTGRWNRIDELPKMHLQAIRAFGALRGEYKHCGVFFQAFENSGSSPQAVRAIMLTALIYLANESYDEINHERKAQCKKAIEKSLADGEICKELAEIVSGGT